MLYVEGAKLNNSLCIMNCEGDKNEIFIVIICIYVKFV